MEFVQLIELRTRHIDQVNALVDDWLTRTRGRRSARRGMMCADRDDPGVYVEVIEFPSYEEAMRNSELPETQEWADRVSEVCESPPLFRNLDVIRRQDL
ncbi:hypothetical protein BH20ACT9_BH20ACT9_19910 [soil metagenome]